jgi:hypothetical protein
MARRVVRTPGKSQHAHHHGQHGQEGQGVAKQAGPKPAANRRQKLFEHLLHG